MAVHLDVRIDAGLVEGKVLDAIDNEGVNFVGRIKNNARLDRLAQPHLPRDPAHIRYTQTELLRQHLYSLALGHTRGDDADTLAHDVAVKLA